jgi:hypothetical protein
LNHDQPIKELARHADEWPTDFLFRPARPLANDDEAMIRSGRLRQHRDLVSQRADLAPRSLENEATLDC